MHMWTAITCLLAFLSWKSSIPRIVAIPAMWLVIFIIISCGFEDAIACRSGGGGGKGSASTPRPGVRGENKSFFGNDSSWGGWSPPKNDSSWMKWIAIWGKPNNSRVDSTEEGRDPESGWPSSWKKLGVANKGVPPPPWALVPSGYGKPQFCFLQPYYGNCNNTIPRWGYNPTKNECQTFVYSGCGGNQNNFNNKQACIKACIEVPSTDCEDQAKVNFEELIYD